MCRFDVIDTTISFNRGKIGEVGTLPWSWIPIAIFIYLTKGMSIAWSLYSVSLIVSSILFLVVIKSMSYIWHNHITTMWLFVVQMKAYGIQVWVHIYCSNKKASALEWRFRLMLCWHIYTYCIYIRNCLRKCIWHIWCK